MKRIAILGAGMVGSAIAADLCRRFEVAAADRDGAALEALALSHPVSTVQTDLTDLQALGRFVAPADLVIGAVPGFMGYATMEAVIRSGKNLVDISFCPEDPRPLDEAARQKGVSVVVDCGVAPGMSNIILGRHGAAMDVSHFECLVGGLPVRRTWPYQYKAPFSPIDVIEEYIRPAKFVVNGELVTRPALSDPEYVEFDPIGTLEAFNTDGLRTLLHTMKVPNMSEKTLRYPGHIEYMSVLRENGFFSKEPIAVRGVQVRPIDVTAQLLFPMWKLESEEEELTLMRVTIRGREAGRVKRYVYELLDRYDRSTKTSSMARTTGYTCTAAASLFFESGFHRTGVIPPEELGERAGAFDFILSYLAQRGVKYAVQESDDAEAAGR